MPTCANCARELDPAWKYCITCGARASAPASLVVQAAIRPEPVPEPVERRPVNVFAVLAVILAALASPLAALFGHVAVGQISTSGERGLVPAWIAVALGYVWLVALTVLVIAFVTTNA